MQKESERVYSDDCADDKRKTFKWLTEIQQVVVAPSLTSPAKRRKPQLDFIRSTQFEDK